MREQQRRRYEDYYDDPPDDDPEPYIISETEDWVRCPSCEKLIERVDEHLKTADSVFTDAYPWTCKPKKVKSKLPR